MALSLSPGCAGACVDRCDAILEDSREPKELPKVLAGSSIESSGHAFSEVGVLRFYGFSICAVFPGVWASCALEEESRAPPRPPLRDFSAALAQENSHNSRGG